MEPSKGTDDVRGLIERLREVEAYPDAMIRSRILDAAAAIEASLAREEALREALRDELSALEADRRWANASELGGIITRCERMEAALQEQANEI